MIMRVRVCVLCHLCLVSSGMCVCDTRLCVTVADVGDGIAGSVLRNQQPAWALDHPPKIGFSQIQTGIYLYVCSPKIIVLCIGYRTNLYPKHNWIDFVVLQWQWPKVSGKYWKSVKYSQLFSTTTEHHDRGPRNETLAWIRARFFRTSSRGNSAVATGRGTNVRWGLKS